MLLEGLKEFLCIVGAQAFYESSSNFFAVVGSLFISYGLM